MCCLVEDNVTPQTTARDDYQVQLSQSYELHETYFGGLEARLAMYEFIVAMGCR